MKRQRLFPLVAMLAIFVCASAFPPKTDTFCRWMRITDIQPTDTSMRVTVRLQNYPRYWVSVPSSSHLIAADNPDMKFKLISSENLPLDERIWMPESGWHEGVLVFEKVPQDVKVVDLVTDTTDVIRNNILGLHIYEPASKIRPEMFTLNDIISGGNPPYEKWTGLNPKQYQDLTFYNKDGKAQLKGKITDYSPRSGVTTLSVISNDNFVGGKKVNVGNISTDGTFELEIPCTYPQQCYFQLGDISKNLYIIPGDTLEIATCMALGIDREPEYFGYTGSRDDGVELNILSDSLLTERYGLNNMFRYALLHDSDSLKSETYRTNELLAQKLDSILTDLPQLIGDLPVSNFVKDMLSAEAISKVCVTMEDLRMFFKDNKGPRFVKDEDGKYSYVDGDHLDSEKLLAPVREHLDLIYDNPLLVTEGMILVNRWEFNDFFRDLAMAAQGYMKTPENSMIYTMPDDVSIPMRAATLKLDSIGLGNSFVANLIRNKSFIGFINVQEEPSYERLEAVSRLVPMIIKNNSYDAFNPMLMDSYNEFVKDVMIAENAITPDSGNSIILQDNAGADVLERIIAPYKGNVLFLDFWGIGCGPCRSGMINQKPMLEQLADQPFKALYIANMAEGLESSKRWLRKEDIKGEHIFVTQDDWNRLCGLFNFSGIPFGVLIGKDGKVIEKNYRFSLEDSQLKEALKQ